MATVVEINDECGKSFYVSLNLDTRYQIGHYPGGLKTQGEKVGSWQTLQKGIINVNSGTAHTFHSNGTFATCHMHLYGSQGGWGIRFNDFYNIIGKNSKGEGWLAQPWILDARYGRIAWSIIS